MTTLPQSRSILDALLRFVDRLTPTGESSHSANPDSDLRADHEIEAAWRADLSEMMSRAPDAFSSELDVQFMLHQYPRRY